MNLDENENPLFKEMVNLTITPMLSTLSLMDCRNREACDFIDCLEWYDVCGIASIWNMITKRF